MKKLFLISILAFSAISQVQAASSPPTYTLTLTPHTVDWLIDALVDYPFKYKQIAPVLQAIQTSINQQNLEFTKKQRADLCELEQLPADESCGE